MLSMSCISVRLGGPIYPSSLPGAHTVTVGSSRTAQHIIYVFVHTKTYSLYARLHPHPPLLQRLQLGPDWEPPSTRVVANSFFVKSQLADKKSGLGTVRSVPRVSWSETGMERACPYHHPLLRDMYAHACWACAVVQKGDKRVCMGDGFVPAVDTVAFEPIATLAIPPSKRRC